MSTDFWRRYLDEKLYAIREIIANKNDREITVKKIRQVLGVPPSNWSAINFYARTLVYLKDNGVLKSIESNSRSSRKYAVKNLWL